MMDGHELAEVVGAFGLFALVTTVITVIIIQIGATVRARAALAREDGYRKLAENGVDAQRSTERHLGELRGRLDTIEERMESLEKILKTVD